MEHLYGYTGKILRVNLSQRQISIEDEDPAVLRKYLGGMGLAAKILYEEVPPGVQWSDPENRIIFGSGPLGGTRVMGSATFNVTTKGPMNEGPVATQANGYFGAFLRMSGFDNIIIQGKADNLCYLYIHDGQAEIRDGSHLTGKDTWETEDLIKDELGFATQAMSVIGIGPAGENLVRFAAVVGDRGHVAGHGGPGAVMGSKNLKAIAVARGKGKVPIYDEKKLSALSKQMFETVISESGWPAGYRWGTLWIMRALAKLDRPNGIPIKNYTISVSPMTEEQMETYSPEFLRDNLTLVRHHPCWACQMHHCDIIRIPEGPYEGAEGEEPEYEGLAAVGPQVGIYNGLTATALSNEVDRLGLECNEAGWVLGMAFECYEKGLLSKEDTGGLELTWGNVEAVRGLLNKIALREDIGDTLAEGAMRAAQRIGGEATQMAIYTNNGTTPVGHDHRRNWAYLLDNCVSNTASTQAHLMPRSSTVGIIEPSSPFSPDEVAVQTAQATGVNPFIDSLGICHQSNREVPELLIGMLNAATGWDFTWEEAMQMGERTINLLRAFYIRHGYTPDLEAPSTRYSSPIPDGPNQGECIAPVIDQMLDIYYKEMGWDRASGKPLPDTLRKLELAHIIPDLWPE